MDYKHRSDTVGTNQVEWQGSQPDTPEEDQEEVPHTTHQSHGEGDQIDGELDGRHTTHLLRAIVRRLIAVLEVGGIHGDHVDGNASLIEVVVRDEQDETGQHTHDELLEDGHAEARHEGLLLIRLVEEDGERYDDDRHGQHGAVDDDPRQVHIQASLVARVGHIHW